MVVVGLIVRPPGDLEAERHTNVHLRREHNFPEWVISANHAFPVCTNGIGWDAPTG